MTSGARRQGWSGGAAAWLGAMLVAVVLLFAYTVAIRRPWFGRSSDEGHYWLTAHTWTALENWYEEGALRTLFVPIDHPLSVEDRTLTARSPYVSYPTGALVPLYGAGRLAGVRPSPPFIMGYNLANHLAIAVVLAAFGFAMARTCGCVPRVAAAFGLVPAAVVLLTPGPMYWLQNVYFADQAVMLPFVLMLYLEWMRDEGAGARRVARYLQPAVLFWGCSVDYLFPFVAAAVFCKRVGEESHLRPRERLAAAAAYWLPALAAVVLFAAQLATVDGFAILHERARVRTAPPVTGSGGGDDPLRFWVRHVVQQYGRSGLYALLGAMLACAGFAVAPRRARQSASEIRMARLLTAALLTIVPCLAQLYALPNHSSVHSFSVLKLAVPLALVPWVALPLIVVERLRGWRGPAPVDGARAVRDPAVWVALAVCIAAAGYLAAVHPSFRELFPPPQVRGAGIAGFLRLHARYEDIVFSPHFEISRRPPQLLAIARKRVYRVANPAEFETTAREMTADIDEPHHVDLLFTTPPPPEWESYLRDATLLRGREVWFYRGVAIRPPRAVGG